MKVKQNKDKFPNARFIHRGSETPVPDCDSQPKVMQRQVGERRPTSRSRSILEAGFGDDATTFANANFPLRS
jgi:hypothetical protein